MARPVMPALLAVGSAVGMIASPVSALELGQLQIDSTLGQPLRASIAYALSPTENLSGLCIYLDKSSANGLQMLTKAKITLDGSRIVLRGNVPIKEALLGLRLTVNCPATPHLSRSYVLMIDPPGHEPQAAPARFATTSLSGAQETKPTPIAPAPIPRRVAPVRNAAPLQIGGDYRVQTGDSLSEIASRIADRPIGLWLSVDALFQANPDAFVDGDKNRIKAGSVLRIPAMQNFAAADIAEESKTVVPQPEIIEEKAFAAYDGIVPTVNTEIENRPADFGPAAYEDNTDVLGSGATIEPERAIAAAPAGQEPGDSLAVPEDVVAAWVDATGEPDIAIPDTTIEAITIERDIVLDVAVVSAAEPLSDRQNSDSVSASSWLTWLGGAGIALILGLLLFGRKLRTLLGGDTAIDIPSVQEDDDEITQEAPVLSDVDFPIDSDDPSAPTTEPTFDPGTNAHIDDTADLDIDLGSGTGFQGDSDMDVAQDFGFSPTGENETPVDLEINAEGAIESEQLPTDIIPPHLGDPVSILDSEVPPNNDDESQYDLSMIVDATKQMLGESDATAKDLMAVQMSPISEVEDDNAYTLSKEIDYRILEQDYENEMTATQALNEEIAKAALELAERMDINEVFDVTAEMHAADESDEESRQSLSTEVTAEVTAELPTDVEAENDDFIDNLEITGVKEQLTADFGADTEADTATMDTKKLAR